MTTADVDIFVGNNVIVDPDVYQLWLNGHTANEAAIILQKRGMLQQYGATFDMLLSDTLDHYRTIAMLERLLQNPPKMTEQLIFQLTAESARVLIQKYYEFDSTVIREILGKKLSSRNRNSLDDVSDKTRIPLRCCRRQFDNVKRVFKTVEEMMGSLKDNIKTNFLLSDHLAQQYSAIVFITNHRFETGKKKLGYLRFDDFVFCANLMIANWSFSSKDCRAHEDMDQDLDRDFLQDLRDLKLLAEKELLDEQKVLVVQSVQKKLTRTATTDVDNNFKNIAKGLINIACGLNHNKDQRDLFLDIVEKFIEPCKQAGWTVPDVRTFLKAHAESCHHMDNFARNHPLLLNIWDRYMNTISCCIVHMYHN